MGALMRAHDWASTSLSTPDTWPQSLRTSVSTCLNCSFPILIWWGPDLVKIYNDAYAPILGVKHPAALGARGRDTWPEIWDVIGPMLDRVMREGEAAPADDLMLLLDRRGYAEEGYFSFSYSPIRDESGGIGGVFCPVIETTAHVIGERRLKLQNRLAERTADLRRENEVFAAVIDSFTKEDQRDFPFVALLRRHETGASDLLASFGLADEPASWRKTFQDHLDRAMADAAQEEDAVIPVAMLGMDVPRGPWPHPLAHLVILPLGPGPSPVGHIVMGLNPARPLEEMRDFARLITGQVSTALGNALAAEAERRRADELAEIDRVKTAFFANISHEFRTPLTLLLGPLEGALDELACEPPSSLSEGLDLARRNALRLQKLVNTLLDYSQIEAGRAEAILQPTDLGQLTADLASGFRSACERAGLGLVVDCPPLAGPVMIDPQMWEKIVLNLLSNAFKFTFEGEIRVTLRAVGDRAVMEVSDTGVGIPSAELPRLFERFHRITGQPSRTYEGSGIGLALVQELVRLQGGVIDAASAQGAGSTFTIKLPLTQTLPLATPARLQSSASYRTEDSSGRTSAYVQEALGWLPQAPLLENPAGTDEPTDSASASRARVFLIDDNADMRAYTARLLRADWIVQTFADGEAALDAARANRPDLVLTDVMLPGLDGFGVLAALRADPDLADIPVIMLSARAGEAARIEGLDAGADDYVCKPFSGLELRARIRANLSLARLRREAIRSLEENQSRLLQLFEGAPGFMCLLRGPDHVFELANEAYMRLTGRSDLVGKTVGDAFPEVESQGFIDLLDGVYASGKPFSARNMRLLMQPTTGEASREHFVDFIYQPITDVQGRVTGVFVEGSDVTAHVRAEELVKTQRAQLEAVIDTVPAAVWFTHDPEARRVVGNRFANELLGLPANANHSLGASPEDRPTGFRLLREGVALGVDQLPIQRAARGETAPLEELELAFDNRPSAILQIQATPIRNEDGEVTGAVCTAIDITDRKTAEKELRNSEEEFRALVDNQASLCWMAEPNGSIYWYNRRWHDYTGKSLEELRGWGWESVHDPERLPEIKDRWNAALADGSIFQMTFPLRGADGVYRPFLTRVIPVRDSAGKITRWFGNNIDISEQQATEEALRAGEEQLRRLNEQLETRVVQEVKARHLAQARLAQAQRMEALGQLAGGIAHDFNNVLQAVSGGLSLIQKRSADPDAVVKIARMASEASERGAAITGRLLAFARRGDLDASPVDGEPLLEGLREMLTPTLGPGITIKIEMAPDSPPLLADKAQLETVLVNLAINARDAMPEGGDLTFSWSPEIVSAPPFGDLGMKEGRYIRLEIIDTGAGMDEATLLRASEPFFTTKPAGQGTGLGLAMARGFAEQSGGAFAISSLPAEGARICLWFPQATAMVAAADAAPEAVLPTGSARRVLLVDDDPMVRAIMFQQLEALGFIVTEASDGLDALDRIDRGEDPALLVTDYSMPGMNGLLLIEEARRRHPHLQALLLTGFADDAVRQRLEGGGDAATKVLNKPVTDLDLRRYAAAALLEADRQAAE